MPPVAVSILSSIAVTYAKSVAIKLLIMLIAVAISNALIEDPVNTDTGSARKAMVKDSIAPMNIIYGERRVSGPLVYWRTGESVSGKAEALVLAVVFTEHQVNSIGSIYIGDQKEGTGKLPAATKYRFTRHTGLATQAVDPTLLAYGSPWSAGHKGQGVAYIVGEFDSYRDWDKIPQLSAIVQGSLVYDPRLDSTVIGGSGTQRNSDATTWTYSTNPALQARDYLTRAEGYEEKQSRIDDAWVIASANVCDTLTITPNGNDKMYESNISLPLTNTRKSNLVILSLAMQGQIVYVSGQWKIMAGYYITPTITITENDLISDIKITTSTSAASQYNYVTGMYYDKARFYQKSNFQPRINAAFEARDAGRRSPKDIIYPTVTEEYLAQRHGTLDLNKTANQTIVTVTVGPQFLDLHVNLIIYLTLANPTWTNKSFRIVKMDINPDLQIELILREEISASWNVAIGDYTVPGIATQGSTYNPFLVPPHTNLIFDTGSSTARILSGGAVQAVARLSWTLSVDEFLKETLIRYRVTGGTSADWKELVIQKLLLTIDIDLSNGVNYDFEVIAINQQDIASSPLVSSNRLITASDVAPDQLGAITTVPNVLGITLSVSTASITNTDISAIEWAFNVINDVTNINTISTTKSVPAQLGSGAVPPITSVTETFNSVGNKYVWARVVNTSGKVSPWNTANTSGTLTIPGATPPELLAIQGTVNFIPPASRNLRLVGTDTLMPPFTLGTGLRVSPLNIYSGDKLSFSSYITHSTENTAQIVLIFRDNNNAQIGPEFAVAVPAVAAPAAETLVKYENILVPAATIKMELISRVGTGLFYVRDSVLNKGTVVLPAETSWGGRLIDPNDGDVFIGYGDSQNLLDGQVEPTSTVTPGTVAPGGGPVSAPSSGGGYYNNTQLP